MDKRFVIAITGASGVPYALSLIEQLLLQHFELHLIVTEAGWRVLREEEGWHTTNREENFTSRFGHLPGQFILHSVRDIGATIASGSFLYDAMVVVPCSMGSLARIAHGISSNLVERAADVTLKEGRKLILVPRETPLNTIHLQNMLELSKQGVVILPAMPGFYSGPSRLEDVINFVVGKILDNLGLEHEISRRWSGC